MDPAALPAGSLKHRDDGTLQPFVGVAHGQLHASQSTGDQPSQELQPEGSVLARPDFQPQDPAGAGAGLRDDFGLVFSAAGGDGFPRLKAGLIRRSGRLKGRAVL